MSRGDSYREVFAHRGFRDLWIGHSVAFLGRSIAHVAIALYVYELTGSASALSFAIALELLPYVVMGPLAGLLADRLERKVILVSAYALQAGLVACLPFTTTLGQMYVLVFLSSLMGPVSVIVRAAALPSVTGQELFVRGSSLDIVAFNAVNVIGPPVGGWMVGLLGAKPTFFLVMACFLAAATFAARVNIAPAREDERDGFGARVIKSDLTAGLRFLFGHSLLRFLLLLACFSSLGWSAPEIAAVVYLTDALGLGGEAYGLIRGAVSLSMALGVFILGRYTRVLPQGLLLVGGVVLAGMAYAVVAVQPDLRGLLLLWFIAGIGWGANWLTDNALWAHATPNQLRGRVYSIGEAVVHLAEVLTALLGGWLVNRVGATGALLLIGCAMTVGSPLIAALSGGHRAIRERASCWPGDPDKPQR